MSCPLLSVRDLSVDYASAAGPLRAVDRFSLDVHHNEVVGLVGESGCGKSTAAFAIARLNRPPAFTAGGEVTLDGMPWSHLSEAELRPYRWKTMSLVFQSAINALNPVLTIGQQLMDTLLTGTRAREEARGRKMSRAAARKRAAELLAMVNIPVDKLNSYSHQLSGGQRQRVCIALSLAFNPKFIIMDEPTTALDVVMQQEIMAEIMALKRRLSLSILFISHDLNLVASLADRVAIMYAGQIVEEGTAEQVFNRPQHPYTRGLINSILRLDSPLACYKPSSVMNTQSVQKSSDRLAMEAVTFEVTGRRFVFESEGDSADKGFWSKRFKRPKIRLLSDINLALEAGKITALVGESGSGKSTIARILTRVMPPSSGRVRLRAEALGDKPRRADFRSAVQMVFQNPFDSLNPMHSVRYHLERPLQLHQALSPDEQQARIRQLLETVGLGPVERVMNKLPHELSGGEQQRLSLARALAVNPRFIVADEPTSMLDVSIRLGILDLFKQVAARGVGILLITHDLATARYISDHILVLYCGHIVERGKTGAVIEQPQHPYTRQLLSANVDIHTDWEQVWGDGGAPSSEPPVWWQGRPGCPYLNRCPRARDICQSRLPQEQQSEEGRSVRCWVPLLPEDAQGGQEQP